MEPIDYIKRFLKVLLFSQVIGVIFTIFSNFPYGKNLSLVFLLAVIAGFGLVYFSFKGIKILLSYYVVSILMYILLLLLNIVIVKSVDEIFPKLTDPFGGIMFYTGCFGIILFIMSLAKKFLPGRADFVNGYEKLDLSQFQCQD